MTDCQVAVITSLYQTGHSGTDIAKQTGISARSCQRWCKKFRESPGGNVVVPKRLTGRPRITHPRALSIIRRQLEASPFITAQKIKEQNLLLFGNVHTRTVSRRIHDDLGYTRRRARKKVLLTYKQRMARLQFARRHMHWNMRQWKNVIWSDECIITCCDSNNQYVYMHKDSDPFDPKFTSKSVKHPPKLMVWACFNYRGVGKLIVLPQNLTMNKERYLELLSDHLYDCFRMCKVKLDRGIYMQDGATCHTAKIIKEYFSFVKINYIEKWPGNSPDINPIENLWPLVKRKLRDRDTSTIAKLRDAIYEILHSIDRKVFRKLAGSIPNRLRQVERQKGYPIKY